MNIVYIATNSYTYMLGISLFSLLENTTDLSELNIYILSPDLAPNNQNILVKLVQKYKRSIFFYDISDYKCYFSFTFNTSGFNSIVLARLLLTHYLPASITSILYLDCDVIISASLKGLENITLEDFAFAAVPELCMPPAQKNYIGLDNSDQYYNAGVLLINLDYWRKYNLSQQFMDYYASMNGQLLYSDQDILNHCCKGHILPLSHRYNLAPVLHYFPRYFIKKYQPAYYCKTKKEYQDILKHPSIIHFLGDERPWMRGNFNPYRKVYEHYKACSPWRKEPLTSGREFYLFCYHVLNCITFICPWFRKAFTKWIGIRYYKLMGKK